jgi:uncharacterized protein YndB with AHSA1/START domain
MRGLILSIALLAGSGSASPAFADVVNSSPGGFTVKTTVRIAASPQRVYEALSRPGDFWNPDHTWSGRASSMTLEPKAGGCFCEALPNGGSVQHGVVVLAEPGKTLRLHGSLGPLQEMGASGALTWALEAAGTGTTASLTYAVAAYVTGGADKLAAIVDSVIAEQLQRLKAHLER